MVKINPVKATCQKTEGSGCGLQEINDTCFGICAAFSQASTAYDVEPWCAKACEELVEQKKILQYDKNSCNHQAPYRPVIWNQVPRFLPRLLKKNNDNAELSLKQCKELCQNNVSSQYVDECVGYCDLDYSAIVPEELPSPPESTKPKHVMREIITIGDDNGKIPWGLIAVFLAITIAVVLLTMKQ